MEYSINAKQTDKDERSLNYQGIFTVHVIARLKHELLDHLNQSRRLELNLSGVSEMDTAGIQLLLLLKREARAQGKTFRILEHSAPVLRILDLYGLALEFGDRIKLKKGERKNYAFKYGVGKGRD